MLMIRAYKIWISKTFIIMELEIKKIWNLRHPISQEIDNLNNKKWSLNPLRNYG